ncbi:MAG: hypothetical protein PHN72_05870 [Bacilli bacterium]|nr:hypothetical protein [Bacilli bacterium]
MIDLHIYTKHSIGTDTTYDILKKASKKGLEMIAITDCNSTKAYKEIKSWKEEISYLYKGLIMKGCAFTTFFEEYEVEILAYHFKEEIIESFLKEYYSSKKIKEREDILKKRLLAILDREGIHYDSTKIKKKWFQKQEPLKQIYEQIILYNENQVKIREDIFHSYEEFYQKGLSNPNSFYFIRPSNLFPSIKEVVSVIHEAGGVALLSKPYQYSFADKEAFINKIMALVKLDGLECFYSTFTEEQMQFLTSYCEKYHLLTSGGTGYAGSYSPSVELGTGHGNLCIPRTIVTDWIEKANKEKEYNGRFLD